MTFACEQAGVVFKAYRCKKNVEVKIKTKRYKIF